jgi:ribulose-5-phosphate 4-epimerase/fuculose-1-phosphate aldolase
MNVAMQPTQSSAAELRSDLATALRAAAHLNLNEGVDNHFTVRVPGSANHYFINPKKHWSQISTDDILVVDAEGRVVDGSCKPPMTGPNIHIPIHQTHPRGNCVFHVHMPWATAITVVEGGRLAMCHQNALRYYNDIAYDDDFNGFANAQQEGHRMADAIGDKTLLFLACHGIICVTETIPEAIDNLYYLERVCQLQVLASRTGGSLRQIPDAMANECHKDLKAGIMRRNAFAHFEALKSIVPSPSNGWQPLEKQAIKFARE